MRGTKIWLLGGLTALVLSGCGLLPGTEHTETEEVHVGDTVSTSPARSPRPPIRTAPPTRAAS